MTRDSRSVEPVRPMQIDIVESPATALAEYGRIPIAFEVRRVLECSPDERGIGGLSLLERELDSPYLKDYDAVEGQDPASWPERFDTSRWGVLMAMLDGAPVGGATLAFDAPGVDVFEGRRDLAVLWDLRVAPKARGRGVGTELFCRAVEWARRRHCTQLKVETQNTNVPACRFYWRQGCELGAIHRFAYPELPDEVQLLWYMDLS